VLTVVSVGVAQLFAVAALTNHNAAARTSTAVLAVDKMEQFRALTWGFESLLDDELGLPVSDRRPTSASFLRPPASQASSRPQTARWKRTFLYVDFLDENGDWLGTGGSPSVSTAPSGPGSVIPTLRPRKQQRQNDRRPTQFSWQGATREQAGGM